MRLGFWLAILLIPAVALTAWQTETVDDGIDTGTYTSIVVDNDGHLHVSYYDEYHQDLKYARYDESGWSIEYVDTEADVGRYSSIAVDSSGSPKISYYGESHNCLKYAEISGTGWVSEVVEWGGGIFTNLELDTSDRPHIVYEMEINTAWLAFWTGSSWSKQEIGWPGYFNSMELGPHGFPQVSTFYPVSVQTGVLYYNYKDPSGWHREQVSESSLRMGNYCSLALDTMGNPYIASYDSYNGGLFLHTRQGPDSWSSMAVDNGPYMGSHCSLALDASNRPNISYHNGDAGILKFARWDGERWVIETVDDTGVVGLYTSLAIGMDGTIHIMYRDDDNKNLKHAWQEPQPTPTPPGSDLVLDLGGNKIYHSGEAMSGVLSIYNPATERTADIYILLEIMGQYWFAPGWSQNLEHLEITAGTGEMSYTTFLPEFTLPETLDPFGPFYFYAAAFETGTLAAETIISNVPISEIYFE